MVTAVPSGETTVDAGSAFLTEEQVMVRDAARRVAREVIDALASYTEISPSGRGLRIFARGASDDWTNHTVGVEVLTFGPPPKYVRTLTIYTRSPDERRSEHRLHRRRRGGLG